MIDSLERSRRALAFGGQRIAVGIAGGSGSGKTTLAQKLHELFGPELSAILPQDAFYIDQSARFDGDGGSVNFDHPSSLDFPLMGEQLETLLSGRHVEVPIYDFATHSRLRETEHFPARPLVIVDGTLILDAAPVRRHLGLSVFVQTDEALRYARRLERDVRERGRTPEGVQRQFLRQVKPMHDTFVEPSKANCSLCVSGECTVDEALEQVVRMLEAALTSEGRGRRVGS